MPKTRRIQPNRRIQHITGAIKATEEKAQKLSMYQLTPEHRIANILNQFGPDTRHKKIMKCHPALIFRIGNNVLKRKIRDALEIIIDQPEDEVVPDVQNNDDQMQQSPINEDEVVHDGQNNDDQMQSPIHEDEVEIPGLDRESISSSSLASLPSRPMSTPSSGNPEEAREIFCEPGPMAMEPQANQIPHARQVIIDETDALEALNYSDNNIGVGIEDRVLAEVFIDGLLEEFASRQ